MEVSLEFREDVALITMDDGSKNVITLDALDKLAVALDKASADSKAIVLAGRPGSFCAGFDRDVLLGPDPVRSRELGLRGAEMLERLYAFPLPVMAACTGHGFTIGAIWMSACEERIGEQGKFLIGMVETKLGVHLPTWALVPLRDRIAPTHLHAATLKSQLYGPEEAVAAGFLDEVVPEGEAIERACAVASEYALVSGKGYAQTKAYLRRERLELIRDDIEKERAR